MGNNLDLIQMLGVPDFLICPRCKNEQTSFFDDYDVECGNPNPKPGLWKLNVCCVRCDHDWVQEYRISLVKPE